MQDRDSPNMIHYLPKCSANCSHDELSLPVLDSARKYKAWESSCITSDSADSFSIPVGAKGKVELAAPVQDPNLSLFYFSESITEEIIPRSRDQRVARMQTCVHRHAEATLFSFQSAVDFAVFCVSLLTAPAVLS